MPSVSEAKREYEERFNGCLTKYGRVLFCLMDNVRSQQVHDVRRDLRGLGELVMGKKTLQKKIVERRAEDKKAARTTVALQHVHPKEAVVRQHRPHLYERGDPSYQAVDKSVGPACGRHRPCDVLSPLVHRHAPPRCQGYSRNCE
ncbi:hypothetical protein TcBrA4_0058090 [Trypanosoma cruzi]|nr:hypothetical protein TcBrA4_0058090 [Trypanosoma cruzi]